MMTEKTHTPIAGIATPLTGIFSGYSQVFFSTKWYVGLIFLAATLIAPVQGGAGFLALLLSNFWAMIFGFSKDHIEEGYFAYNGLLIGLALGLIYRINSAFFIMILIATLLGVFIAASLRSVFERYLFIPVLSTPFVLTTWGIIAAGGQFPGLIYTPEPYQLSFSPSVLPSFVEFFTSSLGAAFFQLNILAGILIAIGLLLFSRQAFILALIGLTSGSVIYILLKGNPSNLTTGLIGFNFALTAIAVGGIWSVPGFASFFLAASSGAICAVIAAASTFLLQPLKLPALAFPFVVTTSFIIYALKHRGIVSRFKTITVPETSPEKNLKRHKNARSRFVSGEVPVFDLPVSGVWTITQGFDGEHTHKSLWRHAWDFEIFDEDGERHRKGGSILENFYSFNMPVFAPADGKVVTVMNHIEDNPVGQVDTENNWGNVVIMWHYDNVYSALCHLKMGSIAVNEGETIRYGQMIGKVGNSGRSPFPHLHFQVQTSHEIGAPTIPSELMHYVRMGGETAFYQTHGCPVTGEKISPLQTESEVFDTAFFYTGRSLTFNARCPDKDWNEIWETDIDFLGNRYLICREQNARIRFFVNRKVLLFLDYEGPRNVGLHWFFLAVPRLPMTTGRVHWKDELPGDMILSKPARLLFDLAEPVFSFVRLSSSSHLLRVGNEISVETILNASGLLAPNRLKRIRCLSIFELQKGLISVTAKAGQEVLFELTRSDKTDLSKI